jgi:predicted RNA polymerase sigma factor
MAQRISRAEQTNEGYVTSSGSELVRGELSGEAIRLARIVRVALPEDPEVAGLLALMLLTDSRRAARARDSGELIPLAEQDRSLWDRELIDKGVALLAEALAKGAVGEYQLQAAIAAEHSGRRGGRTPTGARSSASTGCWSGWTATTACTRRAPTCSRCPVRRMARSPSTGSPPSAPTACPGSGT